MLCVAAVEREKSLKVQALCDSVAWDFSPFVLTAFGSFGQSAICILDAWVARSPATHLLPECFRRPSSAVRRSYVAVALARGVARQLLASYPDSEASGQIPAPEAC